MSEMHRPDADNCIYWTGDRSPVYWGTCPVCKKGKS